ncbi:MULTISPECIES: transposase [Komagataeibacter]
MWTPTIRRKYSRRSQRYDTDLTDAEWAVLAPLLPGDRTCGRPHKWGMREFLNAICYVLRGGIAWSLPPGEFSSKGTVFHWFWVLRDRACRKRSTMRW